MIIIHRRPLFIAIILAAIPIISASLIIMYKFELGLLIGLFSALAIILYFILHTKDVLNLKLNEIHASTILSAINFETPIPTSYFALTPTKVLCLLHEILFRKPELVVECGMGASTLYIARMLKALRTGRLISIEHDIKWSEYIQQLLVANDLQDVVQVIHAELKETECLGYQVIWYDQETIKRSLPMEGGIEMLLIDGPPGTAGFMARLSAGPFFANYLQKGAIVMVDDLERQDERKMVTEWQAKLPLQTLKLDYKLGYGLFQYSMQVIK